LEEFEAEAEESGYIDSLCVPTTTYWLRTIEGYMCDETCEVSADNPRLTDCEIEGGMDVDFTFEGFGMCVAGEALIVKNTMGDWAAYGNAPDHWVSGEALDELKKLSPDKFRQALSEIQGAAIAALDSSEE